MRVIALAAGLFLLAGPSAFSQQESQTTFSPAEIDAARKSPKAYEIDSTRVRLKYVGPARLDNLRCQDPSSSEGALPLPNLGVIINIGKEIWKIIEANRPVVDIKQSYATALPLGTTHWNELTGWHPPEGSIYELEAVNLWGWSVVKARFQVLRTWGGTSEGTGRYLTAVTTEPLLVEVSWGYRFSMDAEVPKEGIINVGSREAPLAAMTHNLKWRINTAIKEMRGAHVFYLQGDGLFKQLGSPLPTPAPPSAAGGPVGRAPSISPSSVVWD